jgi:hypothetical protein
MKFKVGDRVSVDGFVMDKNDCFSWAEIKGTISQIYLEHIKVNLDNCNKSNPYTVQSRALSNDGQGGHTKTWSDVDEVWAKIEPKAYQTLVGDTITTARKKRPYNPLWIKFVEEK